LGVDLEVFLREQGCQRDHDAAAYRRATLKLETVDGGIERRAVGGGILHQKRGGREGDNADPHIPGLVLDILPGGVLGGDDARRNHVGRSHTAGHIHRQQNGRLGGGQGHFGGGPGNGDNHHGQGGQEQGGRHMPAPAALLCRLTHQRHIAVTHRAALAPAQYQNIEADRQRHQQQQP
jgi:hypothetical protein